MHKRMRNRDKGATKYMVTYSDMMTLILVFFIMLFSMSVVDAKKFHQMIESFNNSEEIIELLEENSDSVLEDNKLEEQDEKDEMDRLLADVKMYLEDNGLTDIISATREKRGVVLVLRERTLFDSGEAEVLPSAKPFLNKVGGLLSEIPNMVQVEGHTDNRPITTERFPSNWELSGARASSVIRYFISNHQLEPYRFISVGYGDTRPEVPNTTPGNLQKNRRVIIIITDPENKEQDRIQNS